MSSNTTLGVLTCSRKSKLECRQSNAREPIPILLYAISITHVLDSDYVATLARLS